MRCQDRPAHAGKAAYEKRSVSLDNEMAWLEPGDKADIGLFADLPKANEGAHLVNVAADSLLHCLKTPDIRIRCDFEQIPVGLKAT